jgi:hypothetical protein
VPLAVDRDVAPEFVCDAPEELLPEFAEPEFGELEFVEPEFAVVGSDPGFWAAGLEPGFDVAGFVERAVPGALPRAAKEMSRRDGEDDTVSLISSSDSPGNYFRY